MQDLTVSLVQPDPGWHIIDENLIYYADLLSKHEIETDLFILPEMFTTGFTMESQKVAEPMEGKTHSWMRQLASKLNTAICGSVIIEDNSHYYNRFLWVDPDGNTSYYDKRHLFRMADENKSYSRGGELVIITYKGWKIRPVICYDLRFPVWSRNKVINNEFAYDIILYVANWPQPRISVWDILLKARAIENYAYSIGVNRVGSDEEGVDYNGHSVVIGPKGEEIGFLADDEKILTKTLSKIALETYRKQFPGYLDADKFNIL